MNVHVPEFITRNYRTWRRLDQGRLGAALAHLADDDWRIEHQMEWLAPPDVKARWGIAEGDAIWMISYAGITIAYVVTDELVSVAYVVRRAGLNPG